VRWILCGKNDVSVEALELLVARGDEVWVIATRGDEGRDDWQRSLRKAAADLGVRCDAPAKINAASFVERLADFGATALLSLQYDQILRGPLLRAIGCPCLNFHFALLPRHRGVAPIAFAVLAGDREAGVTLHRMVEDIDAGDVLDQRAVTVGATDTAREVYDAVSRAAVALFCDRYPFGSDLLNGGRVQDSTSASYHRQGDFDFSTRTIDWQRAAVELQRWLRAMIFPPFQFPEIEWEGRVLRVCAVGPAIGASGDAPPGTVVARDTDGLEVAAIDGTVRIAGFVDIDASELPVEVGDRLGRGVAGVTD